jgi:Tol biopolymer transport system component
MTSQRRWKTRSIVRATMVGVVAATLLPFAGSAHATYPGSTGRIAFAAFVPAIGHEQIFTMEPDGTDRTMLTHSQNSDNVNPAWSADGTQVIFERDFAYTADIFAVNADGTGEHRVTHFRYSGAPFFSPDGAIVVFAHDDPATHQGGIWIANTDGTGDPQLVVTDPHRSAELAYPQFSPDGTLVTFTRYGRGGRSAIFTVNVDGTDVLRLTDWDLGAAAGSYRPDGSVLAFNSYSESSLGHSGNIYTVRPDGTEVTQLTNNHDGGTTNAFGPSWSPDGTQIVFAQAGDVYTMDPDGTGLTQVTSGSLFEHNTDWGSHP